MGMVQLDGMFMTQIIINILDQVFATPSMPYWQSLWLTDHGYKINATGYSGTGDAAVYYKYEKSTPDHYHDKYSPGRWYKMSDAGYCTYMDGEIAGKSYDLLHGFTIKMTGTFMP